MNKSTHFSGTPIIKQILKYLYPLLIVVFQTLGLMILLVFLRLLYEEICIAFHDMHELLFKQLSLFRSTFALVVSITL